MFIDRGEWEVLNARVKALEERCAALEGALALPESEEERRRQAALAQQFAALWAYDGRAGKEQRG